MIQYKSDLVISVGLEMLRFFWNNPCSSTHEPKSGKIMLKLELNPKSQETYLFSLCSHISAKFVTVYECKFFYQKLTYKLW